MTTPSLGDVCWGINPRRLILITGLIRGVYLTRDFDVALEPRGAAGLVVDQTHGLYESDISRTGHAPWLVSHANLREDGYQHQLLVRPDGGAYLVVAGCRKFASFAAARHHWRDRRRRCTTPSQDRRLNAWSLALVDSYERAVGDLCRGCGAVSERGARL